MMSGGNPFLGTAVRTRPHAAPVAAGHASKVCVVLRVRPFLSSEKEHETSSAVRLVGKTSAEIANPRNPGGVLSFNFDGCYDWNTSNAKLFRAQIQPMLSNLFLGINVTVFAYGNTGAGKTFTMEGTPSSPGVIPLVLRDLFSTSLNSDTIFKISFLEIYNEKVFDLLTGSGLDLQIREDQNRNIFIANLTTVRIASFEEFASHWETARRHRRSASTKLNPNSSRSHSCLTLTVESGLQGAGWHSPRRRANRISKLHLIDLAGSEDNRRTENVGMRMVESGSINKSLFVLSNVVDALNAGASRIPYRDSKLTRLLQDSLGGRSNALIIANVSPSQRHMVETCHTLNFASKSRQIVNNPTVNELPRPGDRAKRPSPLGLGRPITADELQKENIVPQTQDELTRRVAILEAKLAGATRSELASPLKPAKRKKQTLLMAPESDADPGQASSLWQSIQKLFKEGSGSKQLLDDYILVMANSGSSALVKRLPGVGAKRASAIIEGRMHGPYVCISDFVHRCAFGPKLMESIRQALMVQALYGESDGKESNL